MCFDTVGKFVAALGNRVRNRIKYHITYSSIVIGQFKLCEPRISNPALRDIAPHSNREPVCEIRRFLSNDEQNPRNIGISRLLPQLSVAHNRLEYGINTSCEIIHARNALCGRKCATKDYMGFV